MDRFDKNNSFGSIGDNGTGVPMNDEPTRFLTKEEMDELERAANNIEYKSTYVNPAEEKSSSEIEIENENENKAERNTDNVKNDDVRNEEDKSKEKEKDTDTDTDKPKTVKPASKIKIEEVKPDTAKMPKLTGMPGFISSNDGWQPRRRESRIKKFLKRLCFVISFIMAAVLGFYLAFTWNTNNERANNARQHDIQQLEIKQQELSKQQQELKEERSRLEQEKADLTTQHQELTKEKSWLTQIIDTVTGKDVEDKNEVSNLKDKIDEAQNLLEDVDTQLDNLSEVKAKVDDLKSAAQEKLDENQDVIDMVRYQIKLLINKFL